jgi:hypothetical protein
VADAGSVTAPLAVAGAGVLLAYSGLKGHGFLSTARALFHGQSPAAVPVTEPITGAAAPAGSASAGVSAQGGSPDGAAELANQTLGRAMAAAYGWVGAQWTALNNIVMAESGWNASVLNEGGSGAAGIAQNINGFGPGYQQGNAPQQIAWLLAYIKGRYGTPEAAWQFHLENGYY